MPRGCDLYLVVNGAGAMKLARTKGQLAASGLGWTADVSTLTVKLIGVAEILVPLAALGLVLLMAGAAITHAVVRSLLGKS